MAKKDDILSAEQQINDILESLSKMKKAADMLEGAQKNTDEIISSSEDLVKQIAVLTSNAQKILDNLDNQDVIEEIKGLDDKIGLMKDEHINILDEHSDKLIKLKEQSISFRSKVNESFKSQKENLNEILTKHMNDLKKNNKILMDKNDSMTKEIEGMKQSIGFILLLILGFIGSIIYLSM
tara:strand:+ start:643 stop:1185 length:543 start_codon:yes stop_codon:yes gene_type:complete